MRFPFALVLLTQSLLHLLGFAHAFEYLNLGDLPTIFPALGVSWLLTSMIFLTASVALVFKKTFWGVAALAGVLLSQMLVYSVWEEAFILTLLNIIIIIPAFLSIGYYSFENTFHEDVKGNLDRTNLLKTETLTDKDIEDLPDPVQRYLHYTGAVGKDKLHNSRMVCAGRMRSKKRKWFPFTTIQYNFFDEPTRLSYMRARINMVMVPIYNYFIGPSATFSVRLFGIFIWRKESGEQINQSETVTLFQDMCIYAPASLIDPNIKWKQLNEETVEAKFFNHGITIRAKLHINQQGQLIKFTSEDRYTIEERKKIPFTTHISDYQNFDGVHLPVQTRGIWHYPDGDFEYYELELKRLHWNVKN